MKLNTLRFGEIEIEENRIFEFVMPIIGFNHLSKFVILEPNKEALFKWLQSIEDPALAFPIISVAALDYDYTIDIPDNVVAVGVPCKVLRPINDQDLKYYHGKMTFDPDELQ